MAVDALPSHDSLASLTLPLPPPPTLLLPVEIKSCERHIELAVRRRPIRRRAVASPASRIGRRCIECGASALSIARNLTTRRARSLSLVRTPASPPPPPLTLLCSSRTLAPSCASLARGRTRTIAADGENCPPGQTGGEGGGGADSIDRRTSRKTNEFKNVNIGAARYHGRRSSPYTAISQAHEIDTKAER